MRIDLNSDTGVLGVLPQLSAIDIVANRID